MSFEEYKRLAENISNKLQEIGKDMETNTKPILEKLKATLEPFNTKLNEFSEQIKTTISDKNSNNHM